MAIQGVIFPNQKVSAADHAALFELFITDGIISGCGTTTLRNTLTISSGLFVLKGRLAKIVGSQEIAIPDNIRSTTVRLIAYIDLNQVSTSEEFKQLQFRLDQSSAALVQQDINTGTGTLYEIEWASLTVDAQGNITACNVKIKNAYASGGEGHGTGGIPTFTYMVNGVDRSGDTSGTYLQILDDGSNNWRIKFLKSGTLTFTQLGSASSGIDLFLVGGGGGSADRSGGGGGYTQTVKNIIPTSGNSYQIVVGDGGLARGDGQASTAFGSTANGGKAGNGNIGGAGGSGGGGYTGGVYGDNKGDGGSNGSNGKTGGNATGGTGQGSTTKEFAESSGDLYAGGGAGFSQISEGDIHTAANAGGAGGGGDSRYGTNNDIVEWSSSDPGHPGVANTGGGGGSGSVAGGSGIVIIRNARAA